MNKPERGLAPAPEATPLPKPAGRLEIYLVAIASVALITWFLLYQTTAKEKRAIEKATSERVILDRFMNPADHETPTTAAQPQLAKSGPSK